MQGNDTTRKELRTNEEMTQEERNARDHEDIKEIGIELMTLRIRAGLNRKQIVEMSEGQLKVGTVAAIEKGLYNAGIRQMVIYARLLGYRATFVPTQPKALSPDRGTGAAV